MTTKEATLADVRRAYPVLLERGVEQIAGFTVSSLAVMAAGSPIHEPTRYSDAEVRLARALLVIGAEATDPRSFAQAQCLLSAHAVLSAAHPVQAPDGGEQWVLQADRTEVELVCSWLARALGGKPVRVYGLQDLSAEEMAEGGVEVCGVAHWAADEIAGAERALLVLP